MQTLQVVGIGLSTLDVVQKLEKLPTWDAPGSIDEVLFDGGGPTGTALAALANWGLKTGFVGTVGNDWVGELKLRSLKDYGVDVSRTVQRDQPETQVIFCYVDAQSGERIFTGPKNFLSEPLTASELDKTYITSADFLHAEGFHVAATMEAAKWMHEAGKKVVLDGMAVAGQALPPHYADLVRVTDILICGDGFVQALTGVQDDREAAQTVLTYGPETVVVTKGDKGSYTMTADEQFHTPAFPVEVVDTTGSGDVFHGAFIFGLLKGWPLRQTTQFATAAAALECTRLGGRAGIPQLDDILVFLADHDVDLKG
jgi:sulfofructose kinase